MFLALRVGAEPVRRDEDAQSNADAVAHEHVEHAVGGTRVPEHVQHDAEHGHGDGGRGVVHGSGEPIGGVGAVGGLGRVGGGLAHEGGGQQLLGVDADARPLLRHQDNGREDEQAPQGQRELEMSVRRPPRSIVMATVPVLA